MDQNSDMNFPHHGYVKFSRIFGTASLCFLIGLLPAIAGQGVEQAMPGDSVPTRDGNLIIHPINHATLALGWKNVVIYVDPVGSAGRFADLPRPNLILITHVHSDHFSPGTLEWASTPTTRLVAPQSVADRMPTDLRARTTVLKNGDKTKFQGVDIEAVPAYNTTPDRLQFHPKGVGNGYVLTFADKRVYISGDTEDIPEMRALKNIDVAFVCMNLPYTMTEQQAASAVREFHPKIVYPYHDRGSDVDKFKSLLASDPGIDVRIRDWYKP